LTWPKLQEQAEAMIKTCGCQQSKKNVRKYGKLPVKKAEAEPWHTVAIDTVGKWLIKCKNGTKELVALSIMDPATSWFELTHLDNQDADYVATKFDHVWLCRYPRPQVCIFDNGGEFTGLEFQDKLEEMGLHPKPTTVRNAQSNGVIERIHLVVGDMIRSKRLENEVVTNWDDVLQPIAWAIRATHHTTLDATPGQLVFGRDMLFNIGYQADWEKIRLRKQKLINVNNQRENKCRLKHTYHAGEQVYLANDSKHWPKMNQPRSGPYTIVKIHKNQTIEIQLNDHVTQTVNMRRLTPVFTS
jgi:hypothetical protein